MFRASGGKHPVFRRSRDGLVDVDRRAARRLDGRLHGLARQIARPRRDDLLARPWRGGGGGRGGEPQRWMRALAHHRRQREASILTRIEAGDATVAEIVAKVYENL